MRLIFDVTPVIMLFKSSGIETPDDIECLLTYCLYRLHLPIDPLLAGDIRQFGKAKQREKVERHLYRLTRIYWRTVPDIHALCTVQYYADDDALILRVVK